MADGTITVEVSTQAAQTELERLRAVLRKIEAGEYIHLPTMVREALGPNARANARP